jgi:hypothetical protein
MSTPMAGFIATSLSTSMPTARGTALAMFTDVNIRLAMLTATNMAMSMQRDPIAATRLLINMMIMNTPLRCSPSRRAF